MQKTLWMMLALAFSTGSLVAAPLIIYGKDDRQEAYLEKNATYRKLALSTAAMIDTSTIVESAGKVHFRADTLQDSFLHVCPSERFAAQETAAVCSGFLVAPDLLVTAGHCIKNTEDCSKFSWVFDYALKEGEEKTSVPTSSVYSCKSIVSRELTGEGAYGVFASFGGSSGGGTGGGTSTNDRSDLNDYAIIRLDRKVTDREVLKVRKSGKISVGEELVLSGYPSGLPLKIAAGGKVTTLRDKYFLATVDAFGGNSGSAVFNAKSGEVEGILVRGNKDYVFNFTKNCKEVNVSPDTTVNAEGITYITNISKFLP
jgi:V8-like Glu-specific endopeptidase